MEPVGLIAVLVAVFVGGGGVVYALYRGGYFRRR